MARLDLGYLGGRRVRKCFYAATRREVSDKLVRARRDLQRGLAVDRDERLTLERYLRQWLDEVVRPSVRPSTYLAYELHVRRHLIPELGRVPLAKLTPQQVQGMLNRNLAAGLSPRSVHHLRAVLRRALNHALRWDLVARNVAVLVDPPRVPRRDVPIMTPAEARQFLSVARDDRLSALYAVALALGLRQGEALALNWENVDLDAGFLRVRRALQRVNGKPTFVEPKSQRAIRTIRIPTAILTELRAHRARQLEERLWAGLRWKEQGLVFTTTIGTPLDATNVTHRLHRMLRSAGLADMRFHDLRHGAASLMLAQGVHPRVVADILGHSEVRLTLDVYSHVIPALQDDAADRMERALADPAQQVPADAGDRGTSA